MINTNYIENRVLNSQINANKIGKKVLNKHNINQNSQIKNNSTYKKSFKELLESSLQKSSEIKFSKHAQKRLFSREIQLGEKELNNLKEVIKKLELKGARESLILMKNKTNDDIALLVSVRNKTVITALTEKNMKENVFTNIDSTVIL